MANITAADVNKLRQMTGAGMMDCKNALAENDGDFEKAIDFLRKKGQKLAAKRADREANEGVVVSKVSTDGKFGAVIMINCETDFVAKNEDFIAYTKAVLDVALDKKPANIEELQALELNGVKIETTISEQVGKIGEKITLAQYEFLTSDKVVAYTHQGNRLAVVVGFNKDCKETVGKDIAMQVASMSPISIDKDAVPADVIEKELEIYRDLVRQEGKPENMVDQIAQGKLNKFFKDSTLLSQDFIKDGKKSVAQYMSENDKDLKVTSFKRVTLGA